MWSGDILDCSVYVDTTSTFFFIGFYEDANVDPWSTYILINAIYKYAS